MLNIRTVTPRDYDAVWTIFHEVVTAGTTYAYPSDIQRDEALHRWVETPEACYVAEKSGRVLGTYYIKPNQPGRGAHVCNAGYMVASEARGQGIGHALCTHSLSEARRMGYHAMQYNLVVETNRGAIRLRRKMGFNIIGTLPNAFNHAEKGLVDAHVMYKLLEEKRPHS
ncbi:MAG: N-acetyltransferase [Longimonas sp.]|uniref:GNAT family N-acetyltransferase n=1 Tax=Longimonas sp. TaxID=2039626 RepID=UPI00335341AA